jgi:hypothetical protein
VAEPELEIPASAPVPLDVDAVYKELRDALDRDQRDLAAVRGLAERFWPVSADKPLERRPGPKGWLAHQVKRVLRKLMRWYVEPAWAEQRIVNDALLRLVDDLTRRVESLEAQLRER